MDREARRAAVHGVAEGRTRLSGFTFTFHFHALEKEMATHSSDFMAAVIICSDFGAQENKVSHCFHCFLSICHEVMGPEGMISVF